MNEDDRQNRTVRLADGRMLSYGEFGDPDGIPAMLFNGIPGSRYGGALIDQRARVRGVRVIAPDRPGLGCSTFQPGRAFLDWPRDVEALADALKLERFAAVGVSGGTAYVAACAVAMPERLTFAGIVSGMIPFDAPGAPSQMGGRMERTRRLMIGMARRAPKMACSIGSRRIQRQLDPRHGGVIELMCERMAPADRDLLARPGIATGIRRDFEEAFRQGPRGVTWDLILYARPWGFRLGDIPIDIHLWHGEADANLPVAFGRYLASAFPRCRARFCPNEGHLLAISRADEILQAITSTLRTGASPSSS